MNKIIGRAEEIQTLKRILNSNQAEFLALYGRRRVGKTFLIRNFFSKKCIFFEITGQKNANLKTQLENFYESLNEIFLPDLPIKKPITWKEAFATLTILIKKNEKTKVVLFFDELPWLATKKSALMQNLDYVWNKTWSQFKNLKLVVCGSAASWILEKLINAKGGLHNRITSTIHLQPFTLFESEKMLKANGINLNSKQILDLYMVMGGIPHYLNQVEPGLSSTQIINNLCFSKNGFLYTEFKRLFKSLFEFSDVHNRIIREIAKKRNGISRKSLLKNTGYKSGGTFQKRLSELKESGFIDEYVPYGKSKKDFMIKIIDEYTLFYLTWIEPVQNQMSVKINPNYWLNISKQSQFNIWSSYAFEAVCSKHINHILHKLKIQNLALSIGSWYFKPKKDDDKDLSGSQIDLLIDRIDNCINICEIKFSKDEYTITKKYANELKNKITTFEKVTNTKKNIFLTMITTYGIKKSIWSEDLIDSQVKFMK